MTRKEATLAITAIYIGANAVPIGQRGFGLGMMVRYAHAIPGWKRRLPLQELLSISA